MKLLTQLGLFWCLLFAGTPVSRVQGQDSPKNIALGDLGLPKDQVAEVSDLTIAGLASEKGIQFVERQRLDTLLREAQLSLSGRVSPEQAVRLGQILNVDWFVLGTRSATTNSNYVFLKLVEARTGVIRDVRLIPVQQPFDVTAFVKETTSLIRENLSRQNAGTTRRFVTIGAFEDLSVGNQLRMLPTQIRNYLLRAYEGSDVQVLERDQVQWLTDELRLSLAAISKPAGATELAFSGLWTIDGKYQIVDTADPAVELVLVVQRIGATPQEHRITAKIGDPLFSAIKTRLDQALSRTRVARGSRTEIDVLMSRAKELTGIVVKTNQGKPYLTESFRPGVTPTRDLQKDLANAKEAVKALDGVLLLDPENFEARILAAYIISPFGGIPLVRNYAQEAIPRAPNSQWADIARGMIAHTYLLNSKRNEADAIPNLEKLEREAADPDVKSQILGAMKEVMVDAFADGRISREKAIPITERYLFDSFRKNYEQSLNTGERMYVNYNDLLGLYNHDYTQASAHLNRLLPEFRRRFPLRDLDLLAAAISMQVSTNAAPVQEGLSMLRQARVEAPSMPTTKRKSLRSICGSLMDFGLKNAPEAFVEAFFTSNALAGWEEPSSDRNKVELAYALEKLGRRDDALELLDSFGRRHISMGSTGPWWTFGEPFVPEDKAAELRNEPAKLKFTLGEPVARSSAPIFTTIDGSTLWFVAANHLHKADLSGTTLAKFDVPGAEQHRVTAITQDSSNVYIATYGAGLLVLNKQTGTATNFRVAQGLLIDTLTALHHDGNLLWIGYGYGPGGAEADGPGGVSRIGGPGGLGWFDPSTKKFAAFIASIPKQVAERGEIPRNDAGDPRDGPPRRWVTSIASAGTNDLWIGVLRKGVQRFSKSTHKWATFGARDIGQTVSSVVADEKMVAIACREAMSYSAPTGYLAERGGLDTQVFPSNGFSVFDTQNGALPSNDLTSLALDENFLWVGGVDFICRMDRRFEKFSEPINVSGKVQQLTLSPGVIWASVGNDLYRIEKPKN